MAHGLVLVVDDEPAVLTLVAAMLKKCGHPVLVAPDGHAALEVFRSRSGEIALLVTDFDMPAMNGLELSQAVINEYPDTRILLISGKYSQAFRTRLPVLAKPFTLTVLKRAVEAVMSQQPPTLPDAQVR